MSFFKICVMPLISKKNHFGHVYFGHEWIFFPRAVMYEMIFGYATRNSRIRCWRRGNFRAPVSRSVESKIATRAVFVTKNSRKKTFRRSWFSAEKAVFRTSFFGKIFLKKSHFHDEKTKLNYNLGSEGTLRP